METLSSKIRPWVARIVEAEGLFPWQFRKTFAECRMVRGLPKEGSKMIRSKSSAYGLLAIYEIAKASQSDKASTGILARDVARKYKLPTAYVAKVMSHLAKHGVLDSERGPNGGFRLARRAEKITLWDVLEASGALTADHGDRLKQYPPAVRKMLNRAYEQIMASVQSAASTSTVADML
ncbi:MAG: Rrf2 family transcriptional regulator [Phycisphaerae bacterium]|nr:Rrf2 family transcriptional regulator [Phycisphaerae bacterium]NUQ45890.1 Rrf2 family transcriptional regulator [Phycisphaerae bacterium]